MAIFYNTNYNNTEFSSESILVEKFINITMKNEDPTNRPTSFYFYNPKYIREFSIKQIGRRSDLIVVDGKIINFEMKLTNYAEVIRQAIDHKAWADYSCIVLPQRSYLAHWVSKKIVAEGIGLFFVVDEISVVEAISPRYVKKKDLSSPKLRDEIQAQIRWAINNQNKKLMVEEKLRCQLRMFEM